MGLGAVLLQEKQDGGRDILKYASRKLSPPQRQLLHSREGGVSSGMGYWEISGLSGW